MCNLSIKTSSSPDASNPKKDDFFKKKRTNKRKLEQSKFPNSMKLNSYI